MNLILDSSDHYHVSLDTVAEFERAILSAGSLAATTVTSPLYLTRASYALWLMSQRLGLPSRVFARRRTTDNTSRIARHYFAVLMGPNFQKCFPFFLRTGRKSIYLFDAWPHQHEAIRRFVEAFDIDDVFLSSSQVVARLRPMLRRSACSWVPEGIDPTEYRYCPYAEKDIDVLSLGRRHEPHHQLVCGSLEKSGISYLYERTKGTIIFPDRAGLIDGLARTKISICFPSSMTHPDRSDGVETMTVRYLQSMASKCLILGHAPAEMVELFGYNPVIEVDMRDPVRQIRSLLDGFDDQAALIERNFSLVLKEHTWQDRLREIAARMTSS